MMPTEALLPTSVAPSVPLNYRRGARLTWHQRRRHDAVQRLLRKISGSVLDYGCGYGDLAYAMSQTHAVVGVDTDQQRVEYARQEYPSVPFQVCPPESLPFDDASFDNVASVVVIHFVPDHIHYLREIRRVLRPSGHLLLACKNLKLVRNWFRALAGKGTAPSGLWVPSQHEMQQLLEAEGFQIVARDCFFDPPVVDWKNLGDCVFGSLEQALSLLQCHSVCDYYLLLARKQPIAARECA